MKAQNLDKLTQEEQELLAALMIAPNCIWPDSYMIEVRLDNPIDNLLNGGDGLHVHAGGGSRCYAHNYGNQDWAIVHIEDEDVADWDWKAMSDRACDKLGIKL